MSIETVETVRAEVVARLVSEYRGANPRSRVRDMIRWDATGGKVKSRLCIFCGDVGPSWCGDWPKTKAAHDWEIGHRATCPVVVQAMTTERLVVSP